MIKYIWRHAVRYHGRAARDDAAVRVRSRRQESHGRDHRSEQLPVRGRRAYRRAVQTPRLRHARRKDRSKSKHTLTFTFLG